VCGTWQDISERSRGRKILFYTEWIYYISYINVHCRDIGQLDTLAEFFVKRFIVISLSCVSFAAHPAWGRGRGLIYTTSLLIIYYCQGLDN
jgi:hypothetical protein